MPKKTAEDDRKNQQPFLTILPSMLLNFDHLFSFFYVFSLLMTKNSAKYQHFSIVKVEKKKDELNCLKINVFFLPDSFEFAPERNFFVGGCCSPRKSAIIHRQYTDVFFFSWNILYIIKQTPIICRKIIHIFILGNLLKIIKYLIEFFMFQIVFSLKFIPDSPIHTPDRPSMHNLQHKAEVLATTGGQMVNMII